MAERGEVEPHGAEPKRGAAIEIVDPFLARAHARVGATLCGKWRLDALVGVGTMATVYEATHCEGGRAVVKILRPELSANAAARERFLWEGYVANSVGHDGAVKAADEEAEDGSLFLVSELLDGETLEHRRVRLGGRLPQDEVLVTINQVLGVLVSAHANGIVHQDLKPESVFLTRAGQVKVLDFGVARLRELPTLSGSALAIATGGTPAYMPPEQARGLPHEVDERSDVWSCGAIMFSLLSGRPVHEGRTVDEQLAQATAQSAPPLTSVAPHVAAPVARIVDRALELSKDLRWASAESMQQALHHAYESLNGAPIATAPPLTFGESAIHRATGGPDDADPEAGGRASGEVLMTPEMTPETFVAVLRPWRRAPSVRAVGSATALALAIVGVVWMAWGARPREQAREPSAAAVSSACVPSVSSDPLPTPPPRAVSALDPATASDAPPALQAASATRKTASPAPLPRSTRSECHPPYVVDPDTGKKHWKFDCL